MKAMSVLSAILMVVTFAPMAGAEDTAQSVVGAQYGYSRFEQSLAIDNSVTSRVEVDGLPAYAIYMGMKDIEEKPGLVSGTKMKIGETFTCTLSVMMQAKCVAEFEKLSTGRLGTTR